mgnify:CR=1 FL=1
MCVEVEKKKGDSVVVGRSLVIVVIIIRVTFIFVLLSLSLSPFFLLSSHIMCLKRSFVFFEFRFSMFSKKREREQ